MVKHDGLFFWKSDHNWTLRMYLEDKQILTKWATKIKQLVEVDSEWKNDDDNKN